MSSSYSRVFLDVNVAQRFQQKINVKCWHSVQEWKYFLPSTHSWASLLLLPLFSCLFRDFFYNAARRRVHENNNTRHHSQDFFNNEKWSSFIIVFVCLNKINIHCCVCCTKNIFILSSSWKLDEEDEHDNDDELYVWGAAEIESWARWTQSHLIWWQIRISNVARISTIYCHGFTILVLIDIDMVLVALW